ncbi:MAG: hypothetical protein U0P45_05070 [Acidimicrobiales bacterium]
MLIRLDDADGGNRSAMDLPPRRFGLRTRLIALVLAPAVILAAGGSAVAVREERAAQALGEVRDEVEVLGHLTDLRIELLGARAPVEVEVRAGAIGVDRATALKLLGVRTLDLGDLSGVTRELAKLPRSARPFSTARVEALARAVDVRPDLSVLDRFDQLDLLARQRWEVRLAHLRSEVVAAARRSPTGSTTSRTPPRPGQRPPRW